MTAYGYQRIADKAPDEGRVFASTTGAFRI